MSNKLVSIVIANYNYGRFLGESIASALAQTYAPVEVVFIDDGSRDDSLAIAQQYDITVLAQANQGVCAARNNAVAQARGDYLLFLDADDILLPDALARLVARLEAAPADIGYVYAQMEYFDHKTGLFESRPFDARALSKSNYICVTSLIRREAFDRAGGFDRGFTETREDWELYIHFLHLGYRGDFLAEPIMRCRKHKEADRPRINTKKNVATAKLMWKYPRFFLRRWLKSAPKYLWYVWRWQVPRHVGLYGPAPGEPPRVLRRAGSSGAA
jgi:glycosyltransferase involved in cell wall biosynthesis